jgi:signal recognition particle GTPase
MRRHFHHGKPMFENLSDRLSQAARNITGKGRLTEANIKDTLRQVRLAFHSLRKFVSGRLVRR